MKEKEEFRFDEFETPCQNFPFYVNSMWATLCDYDEDAAIKIDKKWPDSAMSQQGYFWEYATLETVEDLVCELESVLQDIAESKKLYFGPHKDNKNVFGFWKI